MLRLAGHASLSPSISSNLSAEQTISAYRRKWWVAMMLKIRLGLDLAPLASGMARSEPDAIADTVMPQNLEERT